MKYDFESILDRRGQDAIAIDLPDGFSPYKKGVTLRDGFDLIPMWVADMNFPALPAIGAAMADRAMHPAYGYFAPRDAYYDSILAWQRDRNGVTGLTRENIGYENGVLGGVISALDVICGKGGTVLLHSPTYIGFTHALDDNGYHIVHSPLARDAAGVWRMDFEDMEKKLRDNDIHAAVFCSPHNPCGRVWERWELEQAMALYAKYNVFVVSDEIWSDILRPGYRHIPTQSVSADAAQRTVALYAPSKTFNLAGLVGSYHIVYNPYLKSRIEKQASLSHYNAMNVMSMHALIAAYSAEGRAWLDELCAVLAGNIDYACDYIAAHFPGVSVMRPEGTYMLFLDCTDWCAAHGKTIDAVLNAGYAVGVVWQDGRAFHGACAIRMNLALPLSRVKEAFARLDKNVFNAQ